MTGDEQGQHLVGDVLIRERLTVFVAGLHQQRKHVAALYQGGIGPRIGDQRVDDSVETAPVPDMPPPQTPPTQVTPQARRHRQEQTDNCGHGRH